MPKNNSNINISNMKAEQRGKNQQFLSRGERPPPTKSSLWWQNDPQHHARGKRCCHPTTLPNENGLRQCKSLLHCWRRRTSRWELNDWFEQRSYAPSSPQETRSSKRSLWQSTSKHRWTGPQANQKSNVDELEDHLLRSNKEKARWCRAIGRGRILGFQKIKATKWEKSVQD